MSEPEHLRKERELLERIKSAYNDAGELHLYDKNGEEIHEWPASWPKQIAHVGTFLRERKIFLHP